MAPSAGLVMQSTMNSTGSLSIPAYNTLFSDAYRSGARIQTNSWSTRGSYGNYTWRSWQTDNFIWGNKDLLVLFSAGNQGSDGPYSISTQAVSKNVIAVGASESYRPTISSTANNISEMASFSSLGPTWGDGRIKPDVVAPGTWILSTRSSLITDFWNHYWGSNSTYQGVNSNYAYNGGTSMSTPIVAGMAALIAQYFSEVEGHSPSAALIKAAVINGARPLDDKWSSVPNSREGWGRVNLSNSLGTVDSDAGRMKYVDNSTGLTTGASHTRLFTVANGDSDLVITLVWSDHPGSNTSSTKLVNDLDLKVTTPDGRNFNGNDLQSPYNDTRDSVNNVERIVIPAPQAGIYTVNVTGYSVITGTQPYAFVLTGNISDAVGWIQWEEEHIPANGSIAHLLLSDSNLTGGGWVQVKVNTTTDPSGELIDLSEMVDGSRGLGIFEGSVKVVTGTPLEGEVSVSGDEQITASYEEAYPKRTVMARTKALIPPYILNVTHDTIGRTLTYMDTVTVTISGTPGFTSWYDVVGLNGRSNIQARDDGIAPDTVASDGNYSGYFTVPNLIKGNFSIRGYIHKLYLHPTTGYSTHPVRIDTNLPRRPANLSISVLPSGNSLRLEWESPDDTNLMSYTIWRAVEDLPGSDIPGSFSNVHSTPDNRTYYTDNGLVDGKSYYYRVSSFNLLGYNSEPTDQVSGVPCDTQPPWFVLNGPVNGNVISREVLLDYSAENDTVWVQFEIARDWNEDMIPDGPWSDLESDTTPSDGLIWDTETRPEDIKEGEWFILRAVAVDEANNSNTTLPLARYSIDNSPPPILDVFSGTEVSQNISLYHLFGEAEPLSVVVILMGDQTIRNISVDNEGRFGAYLELSPGVNEFQVRGYDMYGNGPTVFPYPLYVVYDPDDPVANITQVDAVTSTGFLLDGSGSYDIGPVSRLSGVVNYTWALSFWGQKMFLYGPGPSLHLSRPGPLSILLTVLDAAGNSDQAYEQISVLDDQTPSLERPDDLYVQEDTLFELKAQGVIDNDPLIEEVGLFLWQFSGPDELTLEGLEVELMVITPGRYSVVLSLTDTGGNSISVPFHLTVMDITVPQAVAGDDQTVIRGTPVNLSASLSSDNDPDFPNGANFTWVFKGSDRILFGMNITFIASELGEHRILLKVTDPSGNIQLDELLLTVVTDGVPPSVLEVFPHPDVQEIAPGTVFRLTFNEPIETETIDPGIFLYSSGMERDISILSMDPRTLLITPKLPLDHGKVYILRISEALKDITGEPSRVQEFRFVVRPAFEIIKVNGLGIDRILMSHLSVHGEPMEITFELSVPASPEMYLVLSDGTAGIQSFNSTSVENRTVLFLIDGLKGGEYTVTLDGTSLTGDPLEGVRSFNVHLETGGSGEPIESGGKKAMWIIVPIGILVIVALTATGLVLVRRSKSGSAARNTIAGPEQDEGPNPLVPRELPTEDVRQDLK
ncbi:MAG: S8 family serine peptidase [Candidatus Thermoplasmatota archaeon]|nr:S8 family serine peptidase [Candidatus Thermoplasmatota archaeon]